LSTELSKVKLSGLSWFIDRRSICRQCRCSSGLVHCKAWSPVHTDAAGRAEEAECWYSLCCWV